jgi:hypothetical protein
MFDQLYDPTPCYVMPTTATLRPIIGELPTDEMEAIMFERETVRKRFTVLTTNLPLVGATALRRQPSSDCRGRCSPSILRPRRSTPAHTQSKLVCADGNHSILLSKGGQH